MRGARILEALASSPSTTLRAHRDAGLSLAELRLYQRWHRGPAYGLPGPTLLSVNEYRPHRLRDLLPIARISLELRDEVLEMEHVVGIVTSYQPLGRITYSLSVWRSEEALREFTLSPRHRAVMQEYRPRGYLRHVHWWGEFRSIGGAMADARRRLDAGAGRRVGEARSSWARRDERALSRR